MFVATLCAFYQLLIDFPVTHPRLTPEYYDLYLDCYVMT
jgi:hypothetical protein